MLGHSSPMRSRSAVRAVILAGQHDEEWRRVHAAVVASEWHLVERRHLAAPGFVQDLARLGILFGDHRVGLRRGQITEHARREAGIHPQHLERGDDAVAAECRAEPGNARVRIRSVRGIGGHHLQVGDRARDPLIELLVGGRHDGVRARFVEPARLDGGECGVEIGRRIGDLAGTALHRQREVETLVRIDGDVISCGRFRELGRRWRPGQPRPAHHIVQPLVSEYDRVALDVRRKRDAAPDPPRAADLEDVREVRCVAEDQRQRHARVAVVDQADSLERLPLRQKARAEDVDQIALYHDRPLIEHVGVGQVGAKQAVVGARARAEQQRPFHSESKREQGEMARAVVEEAEFTGTRRHDVAVGVEDAKCIPVLQDRRSGRACAGGEDVVLVVDPDPILRVVWDHDRRAAPSRLNSSGGPSRHARYSSS